MKNKTKSKADNIKKVLDWDQIPKRIKKAINMQEIMVSFLFFLANINIEIERKQNNPTLFALSSKCIETVSGYRSHLCRNSTKKLIDPKRDLAKINS